MLTSYTGKRLYDPNPSVVGSSLWQCKKCTSVFFHQCSNVFPTHHPPCPSRHPDPGSPDVFNLLRSQVTQRPIISNRFLPLPSEDVLKYIDFHNFATKIGSESFKKFFTYFSGWPFPHFNLVNATHLNFIDMSTIFCDFGYISLFDTVRHHTRWSTTKGICVSRNIWLFMRRQICDYLPSGIIV